MNLRSSRSRSSTYWLPMTHERRSSSSGRPLRAGILVDPHDPRRKSRVAAVVRLELDENLVEELVVAGLSAEYGVLEKREGGAVSQREIVAEEVIAPRQQLL